MTFDWTLRITDIAIVLATFFGPIAAIQAQKILEAQREKQRRQLWIFRTLMATRAARLSATHVEALNAIPIDFFGRRDITDKWKEYLDLLRPQENIDPQLLGSQRVESFNGLMLSISTFLNFGFSKLEISREVYSPTAHATIEAEQTSIREGFAKVLRGEAAIQMDVRKFPMDEQAAVEQGQLRELLVKWLSGQQSVRVDVKKPGEV